MNRVCQRRKASSRPFGEKRFHGKAVVAQSLDGALNCPACFLCYRNVPVVLEIANAQLAQGRVVRLAQGDGRGIRVAIVGPGHDVEHQLKVAYGSRHRTDDAEKREGTGTRRKVSGCGNAAGSRLQSANA